MSERNPALGGKHANSGQPNRKVMKRLNRRVIDWTGGSQSKEGKVQNRWDNGGYHKPGSMQKH